jgi:hypothetical protein
MSDMIAYCGLNCAECNAFRATKTKDTEWKEQLAKKWTEGLKVDFNPEDIDCDGCISDRISGWCRKICKIRPCAEVRKVKTCALCDDYPCARLKEFLSEEPIAKRNLEEIWKTLQL